MIALDTNLLVYAHRPETADHEGTRAALDGLRSAWALPWPVAHEFVRVVTEPRWFREPTPLDRALHAIEALLESGGCVPIAETRGHWLRLAELAVGGRAGRTMVYDARIAAICIAHGVEELWTADRDFSRFPDLRTRNPLVGVAPESA